MYIQWLCSFIQTRRICRQPGFRNNRQKYKAPLLSCPFFIWFPASVEWQSLSYVVGRFYSRLLASWKHICVSCSPDSTSTLPTKNQVMNSIGKWQIQAAIVSADNIVTPYPVSGGIVWCSELFSVWQLDGKTIHKLCGLIMHLFWVKQYSKCNSVAK